MMSELDNFTFSSEMLPEDIPIDMVAAEVGCWLERGRPDTKPVPTVALKADLVLGDGIAAFNRQKQPVGYIAFRPSAALPVSIGGGRPQLHPHFKIESWVIREGMRGQGLGGMLLNFAELAIRSQVYAESAYHGSGTSYALVSAVAGPNSVRLFYGNGFQPEPQPIIEAAHGYSPYKPLRPKKQIVSKWIEVSAIGGNPLQSGHAERSDILYNDEN